ncbi:MAG: class I fructose-bisphosphate aldolase, partial [Pacificimonas sp.]
LWERGVVPFLKVDKGLEDEVDGVQLMKPNPDLEALLDRAKEKEIFGTKMRSVINHASQTGIAAIVDQQFEVGARILAKGLMPIIEPEVNIKSDSRADCDAILLEELMRALDGLPDGERVMLKLSLPVNADLYVPLVAHPKVARVVALSGGFSQDDACAELRKNHGMIASFSRALLQDLRHDMDDAEFDRTLADAINRICSASTT